MTKTRPPWVAIIVTLGLAFIGGLGTVAIVFMLWLLACVIKAVVFWSEGR